MTKIDALRTIMQEAQKDGGTRKRMLRTERALKALDLDANEIQYGMCYLDYWDSDGQPYSFYREAVTS